MSAYKIEHEEVTGINGVRHLKGQTVDESHFHEGSIKGLVSAGAISVIEEKKVKKQESENG